MPTIGTLSGSVATLLKLGSRYERPMPPATSASITSPPFGDQGLAQWISRINPISAPETRYCGADRKSIAFLTNWTRNI